MFLFTGCHTPENTSKNEGMIDLLLTRGPNGVDGPRAFAFGFVQLCCAWGNLRECHRYSVRFRRCGGHRERVQKAMASHRWVCA
jgi:hypothetical protein